MLEEMVQRKLREKMLDKEAKDLHFQLNEALIKHENLKTDIAVLQERYLEVSEALRETQEELRSYQRRPTNIFRSASVDSLYDSLASELEAFDSGCYNTPYLSARYDNIIFSC